MADHPAFLLIVHGDGTEEPGVALLRWDVHWPTGDTGSQHAGQHRQNRQGTEMPQPDHHICQREASTFLVSERCTIVRPRPHLWSQEAVALECQALIPYKSCASTPHLAVRWCFCLSASLAVLVAGLHGEITFYQGTGKECADSLWQSPLLPTGCKLRPIISLPWKNVGTFSETVSKAQPNSLVLRCSVFLCQWLCWFSGTRDRKGVSKSINYEPCTKSETSHFKTNDAPGKGHISLQKD